MNRKSNMMRPIGLTAFLLLIAAFSWLFVANPLAEAKGPKKPKRLQGQVPIEDQDSGRSQRPYKKKIKVVGHNNILNRGFNGNLGWVDDCAYVSAYYGVAPVHDPAGLAGLAVVDVSNPKKPQLVTIKEGVTGTRESQVEGNQDSRMVVVMPFSSRNTFNDPRSVSQFTIYDVPAKDCTAIVRKGTYFFDERGGLSEEIVPHEHKIWRHIIYGIVSGSTTARRPTLIVVDASDKDNPVLLTTWDLFDEGGPESSAHDLDISPDGTRAYVNLRIFEDGITKRGLMILDTSEIARGDSSPTIKQVTLNNAAGNEVFSPFLSWRPPENFGGTHSTQLVNIQGRKYVVMMDETFATGGSGRCPWGWARIIDVTDETNPIQISTFRLEVNQRRNCDETLPDNAMYSSHYLGVDNPEETKLLAMTWYSSGLRVVNISDPYDPKEVGFFIPGATTDTFFQEDCVNREFRYCNTRVDYAYSFVRFHKGNIWFNSVMGGFWVVKFKGKLKD